MLVPLAAGNFLCVGASDLLPEINKHENAWRYIERFLAFIAGMLLLLLLRVWGE